MEKTELTAAEILLKRTLPVLSNVELAGQVDTDVTLKWEK